MPAILPCINTIVVAAAVALAAATASIALFCAGNALAIAHVNTISSIVTDAMAVASTAGTSTTGTSTTGTSTTLAAILPACLVATTVLGSRSVRGTQQEATLLTHPPRAEWWRGGTPQRVRYRR